MPNLKIAHFPSGTYCLFCSLLNAKSWHPSSKQCQISRSHTSPQVPIVYVAVYWVQNHEIHLVCETKFRDCPCSLRYLLYILQSIGCKLMKSISYAKLNFEIAHVPSGTYCLFCSLFKVRRVMLGAKLWHPSSLKNQISR